MTPRAVVLLPPDVRESPPLPTWVGVVALLGFVLLCCSTVPAVLQRSRLARDYARLRREVTCQEQEVLRLERELLAAHEDTFAYERALRRLVRPATLSTIRHGSAHDESRNLLRPCEAPTAGARPGSSPAGLGRPPGR